MSMPSEQKMRDVIAKRDKESDGSFYYGVITTGVFCRPSCAARSENLRFFPDTESALSAGFRPCRRCRPTEAVSGLNKFIEIARYIEAHAEERLTLKRLSGQAGLSPTRFQRVFKAAFDVSPKAYQDAVRMQRLKTALKDGEDVTGALHTPELSSML